MPVPKQQLLFFVRTPTNGTGVWIPGGGVAKCLLASVIFLEFAEQFRIPIAELVVSPKRTVGVLVFQSLLDLAEIALSCGWRDLLVGVVVLSNEVATKPERQGEQELLGQILTGSIIIKVGKQSERIQRTAVFFEVTIKVPHGV